MADNGTVKVKVVFDADPSKVGSTLNVTADEAHRLTRDGRAAYATDAQERKAEKALTE